MLDSRSYLIILLLSGIVPFVGGLNVIFVMFPYAVLLYVFAIKSFPLKHFILGICLLAFYYLVNYMKWGFVVITFGVLSWSALSLIPALITGSILIQIPAGAFLQGLRKLKLPQKTMIAITVGIRYFPDVKTQLHIIRKAAYLRGLNISIIHPKQSFELVVVPLLHRSLRISDDLSAAIISKGIEYDGEKTSLHELRLSFRDFIAVGFSCAILVLCLVGVF